MLNVRNARERNVLWTSGMAAVMAGAAAASGARAQQWTAVLLHASDATHTTACGVSSGREAGYAYVLGPGGNPGAYHAGYWRGSTGTWVDLHPAGNNIESYA